ncbi:hypothetical protein J416_12207 [Gracilibacillus halophilus YIM-C55.5]|uniref:Uncharacterized protein n=1 Tax=Gracilibacillus halophilus YIM-C55.5 TaxID=1308866 RepID=N4WSN3_9BACI|nr:hypothetical protein [Gracilibacillus halophilus]ENH96171.1 hypothetical protein J416_12207 [Gracilibacillus halophilus YIM-C55.5]
MSEKENKTHPFDQLMFGNRKTEEKEEEEENNNEEETSSNSFNFIETAQVIADTYQKISPFTNKIRHIISKK